MNKRGRVRSLMRATLSLGLLLLGSCTAEIKDPVGPLLPGDPPEIPTFTRAVFIFNVDVPRHSVTVTVPRLEPTLRLSDPSGPSWSILGADVINLTVTNFFASPVGAVQPNKVRVTFDVQVLNKLIGYDLGTPTFPTPPANETGMMLIPYSSVVTTTDGGVVVGGDGTVIVGMPSSGMVLPSVDWNGHALPDMPVFPAVPGIGGLAHSFFNDASCSAVNDPGAASDCFRYETYGPLAAGTLSAPRRIGFDVDASVGEFRTYLLAVADLKASSGGATGSITGTISSPQRGPLAGARVDIQGIGTFGTTDAAGQYLIGGVGGGARTVTVSNLPAGCDANSLSPANGSTAVAPPGGTAVVNFSVICAPLTGIVSGTITRIGRGTQSLSGIQVAVIPDAAGAAGDTVTVVGAVPEQVGFAAPVAIGLGAGAGNGTVRLLNLPAFCVAPPPSTYSGLVAGSTVDLIFTVQCDLPPSANRYVLQSRWSAISSGQVDLTVSFDPSGYNDPANNGTDPDLFGGLQVITELSGSASARFTVVSGVAVAPFGTPSIGGTLPIVAWLTNTTSGGRATLSDVAVLRFTIGAGAPGSVTTATTVQEVSTPLGDAFTLIPSGTGQNLEILEATLTVP